MKVDKDQKGKGKGESMGTPVTTGGEDNTTASATDAEPEVIAHSEPEPSVEGTPITTGGDGNPEGGGN